MKHIISAVLAVLILLLSACSARKAPEVIHLKNPVATETETTESKKPEPDAPAPTTETETTTTESEPETTPEPEPETTTEPEPETTPLVIIPPDTTAPPETTTAPAAETPAPLPDYSSMRYPYLYINTELTDANKNGRIDYTVTYLDTAGLTIKQASESNWAQGLAYYGASYSIWDSPYGYCAHVKGVPAANEAGYLYNEDEIAAIAEKCGISRDGIPYNDLQQ